MTRHMTNEELQALNIIRAAGRRGRYKQSTSVKEDIESDRLNTKDLRYALARATYCEDDLHLKDIWAVYSKTPDGRLVVLRVLTVTPQVAVSKIIAVEGE